MRVGVVGACASGKSTLVEALLAHGYEARHIAQEHSHVPDMWRQVTDPDVLIFLHVSYPVTLRRREQRWSEAEYRTEVERLAHARRHANLILDTDALSAKEVLGKTLAFLRDRS